MAPKNVIGLLKPSPKGIASSPKQAPRAYNMPPSTQTRRPSSPLVR